MVQLLGLLCLFISYKLEQALEGDKDLLTLCLIDPGLGVNPSVDRFGLQINVALDVRNRNRAKLILLPRSAILGRQCY